MKKFLRIFVFSAVCILPQIFALAEEEWKLKKDEEGILVWTRKVPGSPILEFKSEAILESPPEKVLSLYEDETRFADWYYQCAEARLLEKKSEAEKIIYFVLDMPWPVSDRDSVYRLLKTEEPDGTVVYRLEARPGAYPEQPGRVRVPYLKTEWRFKPLAAGKTGVYFRQHSDAGGRIPKALVNKLCVNIPFNTLKDLRALIDKTQS